MGLAIDVEQDIRVIVGSTPHGMIPIALYGRSASKPFTETMNDIGRLLCFIEDKQMCSYVEQIRGVCWELIYR